MPTSKLWLQHTERAAWESVEALRQKLADAERRIERLLPPGAGSSEKLLDTLDSANRDLSLNAVGYLEISQRLTSELSGARSRLQELEAELARERLTSAAPAGVHAAPPTRNAAKIDLGDEDDDEPSPDSALFRSVHRQFRAVSQNGAQLRLASDDILSAMEAKLDELVDEEIDSESAIELAALALALVKKTTRP